MASPDDSRLALYLDFENLALGARDNLGVTFDLRPVADALAERGRVVVRRAYADWSYFDTERRELVRQQVELIEIPQKMGGSRKNAADIKLAVDAMEIAFTRNWIDTFVFGTGDSDFTPIVHKLRELDKRVIGFGVRNSTSKLLPPACDEFLFYDDLVDEGPVEAEGEREELVDMVVRTLAGLERTAGQVRASDLKRALLRKDPTFTESDHGFRAWGELLRHLDAQGAVTLSDDGTPGNPSVEIRADAGSEAASFELLADAVRQNAGPDGWADLSGLKTAMKAKQSGFNERSLGYRSFLEFCKAAQARDVVELERDNDQVRVRVS